VYHTDSKSQDIKRTEKTV